EATAQADIRGYVVMPLAKALVKPGSEEGRAVYEASALQERQEATAETGAIHVNEMPVMPMLVKGCGERQGPVIYCGGVAVRQNSLAPVTKGSQLCPAVGL